MFFRLKVNFLFSALIGLSFCFLAGCSDKESSGSPAGEGGDNSTTATYQVTFNSLWNATDHISVPGSAHYTNFVVSVHNSSFILFSSGSLVSSGMESLAETGVTSSIEGELSTAISSGEVLSQSTEDDLFLSSGSSITFQVTVTQDHPLVSLASMIAPSPDWIVGVDSLELYTASAGFTADSGSIDLYALNAGTEDGDTGGNFSLSNSDTAPPEALAQLTGSGFNAPFATIQFVLVP